MAGTISESANRPESWHAARWGQDIPVRGSAREPVPGLNRRVAQAVVSTLVSLMVVLAAFLHAVSLPAHAADQRKDPRTRQDKGSSDVAKDSFAIRMERGILHHTNEMRRNRKLEPLKPSAGLRYLASTQSSLMCENRVLEHESEKFPRDRRRFSDRLEVAGVRSGAENIAYRTITPEPLVWAREVVNGWMKSPTHKKNILDPKFRYVGIGVWPCQDNIAYATQVFSQEPGRVPLTRE